MSRRFLFALVSLVTTSVDAGLLVVLHDRVGIALAGADLVAIAVASVVSFGLHRASTLRTSPYYRWVRDPLGFGLMAASAALVDASVLVALAGVVDTEPLSGLLAAKAVAVAVAVVVRAVGFRYVLHPLVVEARTPGSSPLEDGSLRFSVVIPAYRAQDLIGRSVARVRDELADLAEDGELEIVVVDDGSDDATADEALTAGADQVITLPVNAGKGAAVRAGMLATRGRAVAFTDADLAYDPSHLRRLLAEVERGWDVVIGDRRHPDSTVVRASGIRALGSRVVNRLSAVVLLAAPRDTQCGLKGFRGDVARELFRHTRVDGFAFDIEVLHLVERASRSITDIPVHLDEGDAPSTVRITGDVLRLALDLARIRRWSAIGAYDGLAELRRVDGRDAPGADDQDAEGAAVTGRGAAG